MAGAGHYVSEANLADGWDPLGFAQRAGRARAPPAERSEDYYCKKTFGAAQRPLMQVSPMCAPQQSASTLQLSSTLEQPTGGATQTGLESPTSPDWCQRQKPPQQSAPELQSSPLLRHGGSEVYARMLPASSS